MQGAHASTRVGELSGRRSDGVVSFLGVPYGRVERFRPPAPPQEWSGALDCTQPGPAAPQPLRKMAQYTHGPLPETAEQCLSLNVWAPADAEGCPVLVWIHGGGFTMGWGSAPPYDGTRFAVENRAVVVTLNYRLGSLGWLCHPELATGPDDPQGNWGLLDQRAALRWVADNIEAFGGDPGNVTVAGQSAGASCGMAHLASEQSASLFRRLILQSPLVANSAGDPELAHRWAEALSELAGGGTASFDREALLALPAERIVEFHEQLFKDPRFHGVSGAQPTLEPRTIPSAPAGHPELSPAIDVLAGVNSEDAAFFFIARQKGDAEFAEADLAAVLSHAPGVADPGSTVDQARERALGAGESWGPEAFVRLATEEMFRKPLSAWADERAAGGSTVYRFEIAHRGPAGAIHTVDVPLLFGTYGDGDGPGARLAGDTPAAAAASAAIIDSWGGFVRGSDPGWPTGEVQVFGE
jgi:para-nitrobenzyl esterase